MSQATMSQAPQNFEIIDLYYGKESTHVFFLDDECLYAYNGTSKIGTIYYNCINKLCNCKGKIQGNFFSRTNPKIKHSHEDHRNIADYERLYFKLKHIVRTDQRPVRDVYDEYLKQLSFEASGYLNWNKVRHTLLRIRREVMPACPNIEAFINYFENDDQIFETYGKIRGMPFYLGTLQDKMMVFGNLKMISELESNFYLYVDATFGVTPFHMEQLLVVMAEIHNKPRAIAYVVMPSKREVDYTVALEYIRDGLISYDGTVRIPATAMCDYEKGLRNSLVKVWPNIEVNGCLFHFSKALREHAKEIKELSTKIKNGTIHHKTLLLFSRLALLPLDRIDKGIESLKNYISLNSELKTDFVIFIDYFEKTWLKRYKKEDWCVATCPRRTNNNVEGHNKFIKMKIPLNPSPWSFIDGLIDLVYDSLALVAAEKRNSVRIDRSKISDKLKHNLIELQEKRINELEYLKRML